MIGGEKLEIISQIVLWYENSFRVDLFYLCLSWFELRVTFKENISHVFKFSDVHIYMFNLQKLC